MRSLPALETLVALTALQRLWELRHSRTNLSALSRASQSADSSANWSALVLLQTLWLSGAALEPALRGRVARPALLWVGLVLFLLGEALRIWCIRTLGPAWNARALVDPELVIVSRGPYRWIRHPNYLGVLLELVGLPLAGGAWITLALLAPLHLFVLFRRMRGEDELLGRMPGYAQAMGAKGALLPRFFLARRPR